MSSSVDKPLYLWDIVIKEGRQRKQLVKIEELKSSIARVGQITSILIQRADNSLVAGERRLTAIKGLHDDWMKANPEAAQDSSPWCKPKFTYSDEVDPRILEAIELEENIQRENLTWQDEAAAFQRIRMLRLAVTPDESVEATAGFMGVTRDKLSRNLMVAEKLHVPEIAGSEHLTEAVNRIKRSIQMGVANDLNKLLAGRPLVQAPVLPATSVTAAPVEVGKEVSTTSEVSRPAAPSFPSWSPNKPILNTNFIEWAAHYDGEPFNFIHCDFPYGINHHKSAQGNVDYHGAYDDSEKTYWALCEALAKHKKKLIYSSAHIIFWFSMKFVVKTLAFMQKEFPEFTVEDYPLVWGKRQGIAPDTQRRPQRNYETALFCFSANRQINKLVSNFIVVPPGPKVHASQKNMGMLRHFFQLVVNDETRMLDPTCGSGTSLQAAMSLGAKEAWGIEMNSEFAAQANANYGIAKAMDFMRGLETTKDETNE